MIRRDFLKRMAFAAVACGMLGSELLSRRGWEEEAPIHKSHWGRWDASHTYRDEQGRLWLRDLSGNGHHGLVHGGAPGDGVIRFSPYGEIEI